MKKWCRLIILAAAIFGLLQSAAAQQANEQVIIPSSSPAALPAAVPSSGTGLQLGIYFCLLVLLLGAGSYFLKNGFTFPQAKNKGARKLTVSETRMLGNRQFLVVAEYEGRRMLLGVCPGRIELLSELGSKAEENFAAHLDPST